MTFRTTGGDAPGAVLRAGHGTLTALGGNNLKLLLLVFAGGAMPANASSVLFSDLGTGSSVYTSAPGSIVQRTSGDNIA